MNSSRKFVALQFIGLLLLFLAIAVQAKPSDCPENCVVRENGENSIEHCDCSGIGSNRNIRIKRQTRNCFYSRGKWHCKSGTYGNMSLLNKHTGKLAVIVESKECNSAQSCEKHYGQMSWTITMMKRIYEIDVFGGLV